MALEIIGARIADEDSERFWSKVRIFLPSECWEWQCGRNSQGYGAFKLWGRQLPAHRVAYALTHTSTPSDLWVCHRCDNPPCCNPLHLFLGTPFDNTSDMMAKGRNVFTPCDSSKFNIGEWRAKNLPFAGSSHPAAKITEETVKDIKSALSNGASGVDCAMRFGCSVHTVSNIKLGKQWSHV